MRDGIIEIGKIEGKSDYKYYVDFNGFQEGSGSPCKDIEDVEKQVKYLTEIHSKNYHLKIVNKLETQKTLVNEKT